jgi:hypothetical protein
MKLCPFRRGDEERSGRWSAGMAPARRSPARGPSAASRYPSVPFPADASASDARPLRRKSESPPY